jgi:hypothetical protein
MIYEKDTYSKELAGVLLIMWAIHTHQLYNNELFIDIEKFYTDNYGQRKYFDEMTSVLLQMSLTNHCWSNLLYTFELEHFNKKELEIESDYEYTYIVTDEMIDKYGLKMNL